MDLNGDFRAGAGGRHRGGGGADGRGRRDESLSTRFRASASNDVSGGGDRANFQLQSISMTPDGRVGRGTAGRTEDSVGIIGRLWMRRRRRRCGKSVGFQGSRRDASNFTASSSSSVIVIP